MSRTDWLILSAIFFPWLWGILHIVAFITRRINRYY
jgi:hypothetical protein